MSQPNFRQDPDDPESWTDESYSIPNQALDPTSLTVTTGGDEPDQQCRKRIAAKLAQIDALIMLAAPLVLENYSLSHFRELGVDASLLVQETPESVASAMQLDTVWFCDPDGDSFELSFSVPWDDSHSFDVEFEDGSARGCSVNG